MILDSPIITGSLTQQAGQTAEIPRYTAVSSSFLAASASINQRLNELSTDSGSQALRLNSLEAKSASVDTTLSGLNTFTQSFSSSVATSISASNANISALSASVSTVTGDFSSSVATSFSASAASTAILSASIDTRLDVIESSFATTGSNTFKDTQIVSGSLYVTQDLIVQGSSSLQNITGSSVNIGTNRVILNTDTPAVRFGGISVADSGSGAGASGSLFWDSLNNNWLYQHPLGGAESAMSAVLISGPKNSGSLGDEVHITPGKIMVAVGDDHIGDSIITQTDNKITISGTLEVTGHISASNGVVSSSAQLTSSYDARYVLSGSITQTTWDNIANKPGGIVSGSEQTTSSLDLRYRQVGTPITFTELTEKPTLVSGSAQFVTLTDPFTGSFTGSFKGDGSLLSGLTGGGKIHTQSTAASTWSFVHNLGVQYPNVTVYNSSGQIVLPQSILATDTNTLVLEFGSPVAGYATAGIGGIIEVQGRTVKQYFTSSLSWRFEHNFGDRFANIQVFDSNYEKVIPENIVLTDVTSSLITFPSASAGWAVGTIGGDLPSISSSYAGYVLQISAGAPYTASWTPVANVTASNAVNALTASYLNPISQSLVPAVSGAYDLGSPSKPWRHIYVGSGSIYLVDTTGNVVKTLTGESIVTNDNLASLNAFTASNSTTNTFTSSAAARLNSIETVSASNIARLNSLENKSGSLATTGSNTFFGTQTFSGSVYIANDLIVQGSSSIQYITGSSVNIGTNIVQLNTANPSVRYAGLTMVDSGSVGGSGSFLYDSVQDEFIFVHRGDGTNVTSSHFVLGPETYNNLGNETYLTSNRIPKGTGKEHLVDSCIFELSGSLGLNISNPTYPSTRNGLTIQSTTSAGSELVMLSSTDTGFIGGAIVRNANDFGFINRTAGCLIFATNAVERAWINSSGTVCFACDLTAKTIGTNDLRLSNLNYECANYVDGTRGSWLIQEGENDLFIINQISCKKYKFNLIEIK
jgi:hypothetical protein